MRKKTALRKNPCAAKAVGAAEEREKIREDTIK
jgi:hypothetical protein